jgi:hypothetical protein
VISVLAVILLVPLPVQALLTFGPWLFGSTDPNVISVQPDATGSILKFTPFTSGSGDFIVFGSGTAAWDNTGDTQMKATFNNWDAFTSSGGNVTVTFQVTYNGSPLFGASGQSYTLPSTHPPNQFTGSNASLQAGRNIVNFEVHLVAASGASWTQPSTPPSLVFSTLP